MPGAFKEPASNDSGSSAAVSDRVEISELASFLSRLAGPRYELQAEYLHARLGTAEAWGWYVLGSFRPVPQYALAASVERQGLPNAKADRDPWYILGVTRYLRGDQAKVMIDGRVLRQAEDGGIPIPDGLAYAWVDAAQIAGAGHPGA